MSDCTIESGTCTHCRSACSHKPGWFNPGEVEKVAEYLGISVQELFDTKLQVDWWQGDGVADEVFILSPAVFGGAAGDMFDANPRGTCVFFENERCTIHEVKPHECRQVVACQPRDPELHPSFAHSWKDHQDQIQELLGREPVAAEYGLDSMLGGLFDYY
jgi:Fe-S-cluster containining protein